MVNVDVGVDVDVGVGVVVEVFAADVSLNLFTNMTCHHIDSHKEVKKNMFL